MSLSLSEVEITAFETTLDRCLAESPSSGSGFFFFSFFFFPLDLGLPPSPGSESEPLGEFAVALLRFLLKCEQEINLNPKFP